VPLLKKNEVFPKKDGERKLQIPGKKKDSNVTLHTQQRLNVVNFRDNRGDLNFKTRVRGKHFPSVRKLSKAGDQGSKKSESKNKKTIEGGE